ncbi:ABC transporter ATP-binding protein [Treponema brennaborense]|uniref:Monosaccharide-transporting ATPase n=1 Tax=Treponema brennaborense (strain DSM 12168 / CIP 105900 / DD5/3) TaxID=906968 RepID=F4LPH8_TREBD|nr:ABC transporter ATP-binding protein [Treponema brennaborense]AEE15989.1 Monosaccharide-transporting ATPase [Treponema brennaborense DSM 12168]
MTPVISFRNYSFQYRAQSEPTLVDIDLDIFPGEKVLIAGPSGSGKSTLASCINGLVPFSFTGKSSGTLLVDGMEPENESIFALSKSVGTVLQDPDGQFIGLTVAEDIAFSLENDCVPQDAMRKTVLQAAQLVDIQSHLDFAPHALSGGQKQRVSLAGVMVDDVKILLFDEPLANLDPAAGKQTIELIDSIHEKTGATVVIIEHRLEDVLHRDVDRIILMNDGRIVADMSPDELLGTTLLAQTGIREPLYLTALRYAGVEITSQKKPQHLESMLLDAADTEKVRAWYESVPPAPIPPDRPELLKLDRVCFGYTAHRPAVRDVSLIVTKGEMTAVVGRNGAGKSTLCKLICGFETPDSGGISLYGRDLRGDTIRERARHIGYVMQNPNQMISKAMIFDEVALGLANSGLCEAEIRTRVEETLRVCALYPFRNWPISALSFGQKKRVTIASVLVMNPEIIILDEPTAGQDFRHYTEFMEFLRSVNERGVTVLLITHDMHLMLEYTQRAVVFNDGVQVGDKSAARVLCDLPLVEQAALKVTSLFTLASRCGITPPEAFVQRFIDYDREVRSRGV